MSWETSRDWHLVRPLVYYLMENFVPPAMAVGRDILDFSAGLGDLSRYMLQAGARSVVPTRPEPDPPPGDGLIWRPGIAAGRLAAAFDPGSFDLATARMVFQFPTWEGDRADPDTLAEEFFTILRPGGRLVIAFHEFIGFERIPATGDLPMVEELLERVDPPRAAMIRYLGLPPREGPFGESGFGLKVPMLVTSLHSRGFSIERAEHAEPFTFPSRLIDLDDTELTALGEETMALKRRYLTDPRIGDYERPAAIRRMLVELSGLFEHVTWPIVRIVARRLS